VIIFFYPVTSHSSFSLPSDFTQISTFLPSYWSELSIQDALSDVHKFGPKIWSAIRNRDLESVINAVEYDYNEITGETNVRTEEEMKKFVNTYGDLGTMYNVYTPLIYSAHFGCIDIVKKLTSYGADLYLKRKKRETTALHHAAAYAGRTEDLALVRYFVEECGMAVDELCFERAGNIATEEYLSKHYKKKRAKVPVPVPVSRFPGGRFQSTFKSRNQFYREDSSSTFRHFF